MFTYLHNMIVSSKININGSILPVLLMLFLTDIFIPGNLYCQKSAIEQLNSKLQILKKNDDFLNDTAFINTMNLKARYYVNSYPDSTLFILAQLKSGHSSSDFDRSEFETFKIRGNAYRAKGNYQKALDNYQKAIQFAENLNDKKASNLIAMNIGLVYLNQGNYPVALQKFYEAQKMAELIGDSDIAISCLNNIAIVHFYQGKMDEAEKAYLELFEIAKKRNDTTDIILSLNNLGEVCIEKKEFDKALDYLLEAKTLSEKKNIPEYEALSTNSLGATYLEMDSLDKSLIYFSKSNDLSVKLNNAREICKSFLGLAEVYSRQLNFNQALNYGKQALEKARHMGQAQLLRDAYEILAKIYEAKGDGLNALKYYKQYHTYADSLVNIENERVAANYKADLEISQKEIAFERKNVRLRWIIFSSIAALISTIIILWIINRNRRRSVRANKELQQKNAIIEDQKLEVESTLNHLKTTQNQLIQAEKMASLGELTAGIAHEIQNPLNFVNNFSEVSVELLNEMKDELDSGNPDLAKELADDVIQNLGKINTHGKRADSIVKGMLQHSRSNSGDKELTDINELIDEFVRLSYHGLRAKDKTFNATIKTEFDPSIGLINIVAQDVGRVILNILTNAFYEVSEKRKQDTSDYEPTVEVITNKLENAIEVRISDNGNGITKAILDKIFQPFFTTKPTGEGTGLGLSLSYDIITKGHGGELRVESEEGKGSTFIINLPIV